MAVACISLQKFSEVKGKVFLVNTCPFCAKESFVEVVLADYLHYLHGGLIERAFPYLDASQRELIKIGVDQECWDEMSQIFG